MSEDMSAEQSVSGSEQPVRAEVLSSSPNKTDLLGWFLQSVDQAVKDFPSVPRSGKEIERIEAEIAHTTQGIKDLEDLNESQVAERDFVVKRIVPLVIAQEVDERSLALELSSLAEAGSRGRVLGAEDVFTSKPTRPKETLTKFRVGEKPVGEFILVDKPQIVEGIFTDRTTSISRQVVSAWDEPDYSPDLVRQSTGVRLLRERLKRLEREYASGGKINPSGPRLETERVLTGRIETGLVGYVREFAANREQTSGRNFPSGEDHSRLKSMIDVSGDAGLEEEYLQRRSLHEVICRYDTQMNENIKELAEKALDWEKPIKGIGIILARMPAVGAAIQLAEIQAMSRKKEYLKKRRKELKEFLADTTRLSGFADLNPEMKWLAEVALNGGQIGLLEVKGIIGEIQEIDQKAPEYIKQQRLAERTLDGIPTKERGSVIRVAERIRRITGLAVQGDYDRKRPIAGVAADRCLRGSLHFLNFLEGALQQKPERLAWIKFTPFVDLGVASLWKMKMNDFWERYDKDKEPQAVDMALVNLAKVGQEIFGEERFQKNLIDWLRNMNKAHELRGLCAGILLGPSLGPIGKDLATGAVVGKFDFLGPEQRDYERFWLELATPSILETVRKTRLAGPKLIGPLKDLVERGAFSFTLAKYLDPCEISMAMGELKDKELSASQKARLLIHVLYKTEGIEFGKQTLRDGELLADFLQKRIRIKDRQLSGKQMVRSLMAFAGIKESQRGLLIDAKEREKLDLETVRFWQHFLSSELVWIRNYADIIKVIDTAIWDKVGIDNRSDLLACFEEFYAIRRNLMYGLGERVAGKKICSNEGDKLLLFLTGDGVDELANEGARGVPISPYFDFRRYTGILHELMTFSQEWRLRRGDKEPWEQSLTPEDMGEILKFLEGKLDITKEAHAQLARQLGYSSAERWNFYLRRRFLWGFQNLRRQEKGAEEIQKKVTGFLGGAMAQIVQNLPIPASINDVFSMLLMASGGLVVSGGAGGAVVGAFLGKPLMARGIRRVVEDPRIMRGPLRQIMVWDCLLDPEKIFEKIYEDAKTYGAPS